MSKKRQSRKPRRQMNSTAAKATNEFNPDYSQTIKDLKRIGVLASTFFVVLIALSFFLR